MQNLEQLIKESGYKLEDFNEFLIGGYNTLIEADIELPKNVISPNLDSAFFALLAGFIVSEGENPQLLSYMHSGVSAIHIGLVKRALATNNTALLQKYNEIFSNDSLTKMQKFYMAEAIKFGYPHAGDLTLSEQELKERGLLIRKSQAQAIDSQNFNEAQQNNSKSYYSPQVTN